MKKALFPILIFFTTLLFPTFPASGQESDRERIERAYMERAYTYPEHECMLNIGLFPNGFFVYYKSTKKARKILPNPDYSPYKDGEALCVSEKVNYNILDSAKLHNYAIVHNAPEAFRVIESNPDAIIVVVQNKPMPRHH